MTRRRLLVPLAAVVAVALAAAVLLGVRARGGSGARAAAVPGPVLLVPGYGGSLRSLDPIAAVVRAMGRVAIEVPLPGDGTGDLRTSAAALDRAARAQQSAGASSVDVVGYSAGGVIAHLWARELGGDRLARRIVTLGAPHHGAQIAALGTLLGDPTICPEGCRQLAPGSPLLSSLGAAADPGPAWVSLWSRSDGFVTPADSGRLEGALDVPLQAVCADDRTVHTDLPGDPLVLGLVTRALGPGLPAVPPPDQCAALRAGAPR